MSVNTTNTTTNTAIVNALKASTNYKKFGTTYVSANAKAYDLCVYARDLMKENKAFTARLVADQLKADRKADLESKTIQHMAIAGTLIETTDKGDKVCRYSKGLPLPWSTVYEIANKLNTLEGTTCKLFKEWITGLDKNPTRDSVRNWLQDQDHISKVPNAPKDTDKAPKVQAEIKSKGSSLKIDKGASIEDGYKAIVRIMCEMGITYKGLGEYLLKVKADGKVKA